MRKMLVVYSDLGKKKKEEGKCGGRDGNERKWR